MQVESGAGFGAKFRDDDYKAAGATVVDEKSAFNSDILLKVRQPMESEIFMMKPGSTLVSFLYPAKNKALIDKLAERKINAFGKNRWIADSVINFTLKSLPFQAWTAFHASPAPRYSMP